MSDWKTYTHRHDESVYKEARESEGGYEFRQPGGGWALGWAPKEAWSSIYVLAEGEDGGVG